MLTGVLCRSLKSIKILNGSRDTKLDEPITVTRFYQVEWVAPKVNLRELALLRFIQGQNRTRIANLTDKEKGLRF